MAVTLAAVGRAGADLDGSDLLVVGGPTHRYGMTPELAAWLARLPGVDGLAAAAFDTRYQLPRRLSGSAAWSAARALRQLGCQLLCPPRSFFVAGTHGPLLEGELDRAARWADALLDQGLPQPGRSGPRLVRIEERAFSPPTPAADLDLDVESGALLRSP